MSTHARGRITIDLSAIARNWTQLSKRVGTTECAGVVKADAYGLGASAVVPVLREAGCRTFFVASCEEGLALASVLSGARIFVLDGVFAANRSHMADAGLIPVLSTREHIAHWRREAQARQTKLAAALQIDSGLNRLGLDADDIQALKSDPDALAGIDVKLNMSHLASGDDPDARENELQRQAFETHLPHLPAAPASLAASDGLMLGTDYHYDLVRPGYALYGGQAFRGRQTPVEPVVTVTAQILQVRTVRTGDAVGYSATFRARSDIKVAIIAAGYGDGIPRTASAETHDVHGMAAIHGHRVPVVGRVSMDLVALDVTSVPESVLEKADAVELIGPTVTLDEAGHNAGTIGYEILTRLGHRFARTYTTGDPT